MRTYYTRYCDVLRGEVLYWMYWPLVRVTRNRLGREVREMVATGNTVKHPTELGKVEIRASLWDNMRSNSK